MASPEPVTQNGNLEGGLTAAQKLQQLHHPHPVEVEEVPDEEDLQHRPQPESSSIVEGPGDEAAPGWASQPSAKAAGKQKENLHPNNPQKLDTHSEEAFPSLAGGPKSRPQAPINSNWKDAIKTGTNGTNGTPHNGVSTPTSGIVPVQEIPRKIKIPGQVTDNFTLPKEQLRSRQELKKPIPEILKDINKRSKATVTSSARPNHTIFTAAGPTQEVVQQALKDVLAQVGAEFDHIVTVPQAARAQIIGKQGSKIKELQEKSGARIQVPKTEDVPHQGDDDDDPTVSIVVNGNALSIAQAEDAIKKIVGERGSNVTKTLRTIPAEFYPFIEQQQNDSSGVNVKIPPYHIWRTQPPPEVPAKGQSPEFLSAADNNHIILTGDRTVVQTKKDEIERLAEQLQRELTVDPIPISRNRHQHVIGRRGISPEQFFLDTGCAIILPSDANDDTITIVGRPDQIKAASDKVNSLVGGIRQDNYNALNQFKGFQNASTHVGQLAQYLRERKAIEALEKQHDADIITPEYPSTGEWQFFSREFNNITNAKKEITSILQAHPPSRFSTVEVDPFFYQHLKHDISPRVIKEFGVHVVTPGESQASTPVLLVFEGEGGQESNYEIPRGKPSSEEVRAFQQGLEDARKHILDLIAAQAEITSTTIDVPQIFHRKLQNFLRNEQKGLSADEFPVRVSARGTLVTLRGPAPAVKTLAEKVDAFVEQAKQDEKERDFVLSFDFPQKHANQLVGKGGSMIKELREKFDLEIKIADGKVDLKGPRAKAEAAKSHISNLGRQWADEVTHTLKIDPKFHPSLIGTKGENINRLQSKYKVQIHFPRSHRPVKAGQSNDDAASEAGRKGVHRDQAPDEVIIRGPKKGADEARSEILDFYQYLADNSHTATISVQQSQIPSLIGARGKVIEEIREETKVQINIPSHKDSDDPTSIVDIEIKGTKSGVLQAKKILEEKKKIFDQTISKTLEVDKKHHSVLIGTQGSNIRSIILDAGGSDDRQTLARTVQFPKTEADGNLVKIEGNKDVVEKIITAIQRIVAERDKQITETIDVPTDKHRLLIGRGGEIRKDLESKFKVSIDIPRQGNSQAGVKITGLPADVEKAKTHILEFVKNQEGEIVQVPTKVHHAVSDNIRRKLQNEHQIKIDHSGQRIPSKPTPPTNARSNGDLPLITDEAPAQPSWNIVETGSDIDGEIPWVLRGSPENVSKAKVILSAAIEQALKQTTTGYLVLPDPRTYRYVVGQAGSKVNSIRKATGCQIVVPRDQAKDEAIAISGTREGVEKAKELVLQAVKDGQNAANGSRV